MLSFPSYQSQATTAVPAPLAYTYTNTNKILWAESSTHYALSVPSLTQNHTSGVSGHPTPHLSHLSHLSVRVSNPANFGTFIKPPMVNATAESFSGSIIKRSPGQSSLPSDTIVLNSRASLLYEQRNIKKAKGTTHFNESPTSLPVTQTETANPAVSVTATNGRSLRHGDHSLQHDLENYQPRDDTQPLPFFVQLHNQAHSHCTLGG